MPTYLLPTLTICLIRNGTNLTKTITDVMLAWAITEFFAPMMTDRQTDKENLGVIDNSNRQILDGKQYDQYFPQADNQTYTVKPDGLIEKDTLPLMIRLTKEYSWQTKGISKILKKDTTQQTLQAVFNFTFNHIRYRLDQHGTEQVRTPARSWHDRRDGIDCDCFSVFIGSILKNLKIPFSCRIADYGNGWQHVYVVATDNNKEVILDPVILKYNYEKRPIKYKDFTVA